MTRTICAFSALVFLAACGPKSGPADSAAPAAAAPASLDNQAEKFSYSAGVEIGQRLQVMDDIDLASLQLGITHGMKGSELLLEQEEMAAVKAEVYQAAQQKRQAEMEKQGEAALTRGREFLQKNASADGVKVTESGLQYQSVTEGKGDQPKPEDTVVVHYSGKLINGTEFDSSYKRGQPAEFRLNAVIKGWTEGLQMMKPGGKAKLFIPSELAYGARGAGNSIGPNETLVFDVELIEIKPNK